MTGAENSKPQATRTCTNNCGLKSLWFGSMKFRWHSIVLLYSLEFPMSGVSGLGKSLVADKVRLRNSEFAIGLFNTNLEYNSELNHKH